MPTCTLLTYFLPEGSFLRLLPLVPRRVNLSWLSPDESVTLDIRWTIQCKIFLVFSRGIFALFTTFTNDGNLICVNSEAHRYHGCRRASRRDNILLKMKTDKFTMVRFGSG